MRNTGTPWESSCAGGTRSKLVEDSEGPRLQKRSKYPQAPNSLGTFLTHVVTKAVPAGAGEAEPAWGACCLGEGEGLEGRRAPFIHPLF